MKLNGNFVLRDIAGESMLIPVGEASGKVNGIITLNESGVVIWNALNEKCDKDYAVSKLTEEFDVDDDTAKADVDAFISRIAELGLIEL